MAHTFAYTYIGKVKSEAPQVKRHMVQCAVTLSTDAGDAYSRTIRIAVAFSRYLSNVESAIVFSGIPVGNTGMVPVLASISTSTVTIGLLESGPDVQGPLREKAEEVHDQAYVLYVIAIGI